MCRSHDRLQPARRLVMGNLENQRMEDIWHKPAYIAFRERFRRRLALYEQLMPPVRADFEGLENLQQAVARLNDRYEEEAFRPPVVCRGCPHLLGY